MLVDMDEKGSFPDISFPEGIMPESKSVIMIIHDPRWYSGVFEKDEILESFACCDFPANLSFDNSFFSNLHIPHISLYKTWYDYRSVITFIEIEAIVGDGRRNDARSKIHAPIIVWN